MANIFYLIVFLVLGLVLIALHIIDNKKKKQRVKDIKKDIKGYNDSITRAKNDIDVITKEIEELKERKNL